MPRVCIVEPDGHPAPGALGRRLAEIQGFAVRTVPALPDQLDATEAIVLNSIPSAEGSIPENAVLEFIKSGGGVFAVHDSVYPYAYNKNFIAACGIRAAYGGMQLVAEPGRSYMQVNLAMANIVRGFRGRNALDNYRLRVQEREFSNQNVWLPRGSGSRSSPESFYRLYI